MLEKGSGSTREVLHRTIVPGTNLIAQVGTSLLPLNHIRERTPAPDPTGVEWFMPILLTVTLSGADWLCPHFI